MEHSVQYIYYITYKETLYCANNDYFLFSQKIVDAELNTYNEYK